MRHRQVTAADFPIHSSNTSQPTKGLKKFWGFSSASLATLDFKTAKEFRVEKATPGQGGTDRPRCQIRKAFGAGKLSHFARDFGKINEKKGSVSRFCTEMSNQGTDFSGPLITLRGKK
jgi:hypothetical protein